MSAHELVGLVQKCSPGRSEDARVAVLLLSPSQPTAARERRLTLHIAIEVFHAGMV